MTYPTHQPFGTPPGAWTVVFTSPDGRGWTWYQEGPNINWPDLYHAFVRAYVSHPKQPESDDDGA